MSEKTDEMRFRRRAAKKGYKLVKSRDRSTHLDNFGGYMIVDCATNCVVAGSRFDVQLADLDGVLASLPDES